MTTNDGFTRVRLHLADGPALAESPWVSDLEIDQEDAEHATGVMANHCFGARVGYGDKVELRLVNDEWQIIDLLERNSDMLSFQVLLASEEELANGNFPDEMTARERYVLLTEAMNDEVPEFKDLVIEGGIGFIPIVIVGVGLSAASDEVVDFMENASDRFDVSVFKHSHPLDLADERDEIMADISTEPIPQVELTNTTYVASEDDFWETTFGPDDLEYIHSFVDEIAAHDKRVSTDLESGRYDRVMLLMERLLTDPEDLPPLEYPIWED